jgi:hypothetical protein
MVKFVFFDQILRKGILELTSKSKAFHYLDFNIESLPLKLQNLGRRLIEYDNNRTQ